MVAYLSQSGARRHALQQALDPTGPVSSHPCDLALHLARVTANQWTDSHHRVQPKHIALAVGREDDEAVVANRELVAHDAASIGHDT